MAASGDNDFHGLSSRRQAQLAGWRGRFVRVAGLQVSYIIEQHWDPERVDHVWIDLRAGAFGVLRIALNTWSKKNRDAGFDERVFVGLAPSAWEELPEHGVFESGPRSYTEVTPPVEFVPLAVRPLEELMIEKTKRSICLEAWGELFVKPIPGIHEVHCRRASCGVSRDIVGRDGAVRFYFEEEKRTELMLLKFCGQL